MIFLSRFFFFFFLLVSLLYDPVDIGVVQDAVAIHFRTYCQQSTEITKKKKKHQKTFSITRIKCKEISKFDEQAINNIIHLDTKFTEHLIYIYIYTPNLKHQVSALKIIETPRNPR